MFRKIRRKKNEISLEAAKSLLRSARRGILAVNGDNEYPYAIPINYLYDEDRNKIFFHGSRAGHKIDALKASDKICFTVLGDETIKEETWAPFVQSALVFGRCRLIATDEAALSILKQFALKYFPNEDMVDEEIEASGKAVQMFVIDIEHISGKEVQEK